MAHVLVRAMDTDPTRNSATPSPPSSERGTPPPQALPDTEDNTTFVPETSLPSSSTTAHGEAKSKGKHHRSKKQDKARGKEKRRRARKASDITLSTDASIVQQHKIRAKILDRVAHVGRHVEGSSLRPASSGYVGTRRQDELPEKREYTLEELTSKDGMWQFDVLKHDPRCVSCHRSNEEHTDFGYSRSTAILHSASKSIIAKIIPGELAGPGWEKDVASMNETIRRLRPNVPEKPSRPTKAEQNAYDNGTGGPNILHPRRGLFTCLTSGVSHDQGQQVSIFELFVLMGLTISTSDRKRSTTVQRSVCWWRKSQRTLPSSGSQAIFQVSNSA